MTEYISVPRGDVLQMKARLIDLMNTWQVVEGKQKRFCYYCRNKANELGELKHYTSCEGKTLNDRLDQAMYDVSPPVIQEDFTVKNVLDLLDKEAIEPDEGVQALKYLYGICFKEIDSRTCLTAIRKIKEKMGISA